MINLEFSNNKYYKIYNFEQNTIVNKYSVFAKKCKNQFAKHFTIESGESYLTFL